MKLTNEQIVAMAVAAVADAEGLEVKALRVRSFREVRQSPLAQYVADRGIQYKKYQLGE